MKQKVEDREHFLECHYRWCERTNRNFENLKDNKELSGMMQCMICVYYIRLCGEFIEDWGVCSYKESEFDGMVRYEHDGCTKFVEAEDQWQLQVPKK